MKLEEVRELKEKLIREMDLARKIQKISGLINTQDNRMTSHPLFLVQQKVRTTGFDPDYADDNQLCWIGDDGEVDEETSKELFETYEKGGFISNSYTLTGFVDSWEFVTCCFTNSGAEAYIKANGHNLNEPRIYVASGYGNSDWITVRDFLKALCPNTES